MTERKIRTYPASEAHKPKRRLEKVAVPGGAEAVAAAFNLKNDIELILDSGITAACFARTMGVSSWTVWAWRHGRCAPREPMIVLSIKGWAERLRESTEDKE